MKEGPRFADIGALLGDPARANMLAALMQGEALAASELAREAGVTAQTASGHLAQLLAGGLIAVVPQGRHRYYRLAGADVATAIEGLMDLAERSGPRRTRPGPKDREMRQARVCYDHLAGERGVELFRRLARLRLLAFTDGELTLTHLGERRFAAFGIDVAALKALRRPLCRACLDWSERRPHLAGSLGASLLDRLLERHWAYRVKDSRALRFTPRGETEFARLFTAAT